MPTIIPRDRDHAADLARRLLDAAGPQRRGEVRTLTEGRIGLAFDVPDDIAAAVLGVPVGEALPPTAADAATGPEIQVDEDVAGSDSDAVDGDAAADSTDRAGAAGGRSDTAVDGSAGHRGSARRSRR